MANLKTFSVVLVSAFALINVVSAANKGKGHNEQCVPYETSTSCDSSKGLMCLDSGLKGYRCLCPSSNKLHAQLFDPKRNACVGKVLNACVRTSTGSKSALNETLCVDNSECNLEVYGMPVCLCQAGFTEQDDGTCTQSLKYGDPCGVSLEKQDRGQCDEKHGLKCINDKCQCRFGSDQYYDSIQQTCISYAGRKCSENGQVFSCVRNSKCPAPTRRLGGIGPLNLPPLPPFLNPFASASVGAGGGDDVYVMSLRPRLPPPPPHPHRHTLHMNIPFPPHSKQDPTIEYDTGFDNYDFAARSIFFGAHNNKREGAGGAGGNGGNGGEESAESSASNRCQCLPGFTRTADGYCMIGYGKKCDDMITVQKNENDTLANGGPRELCNADQFLECMDAHDGSFTCQCRNQMNERFDQERNECVAMVGRRCRPNDGPKCEKGSMCVNGTCHCETGTSLTPMDTCARDYGEKCEPGQCNVWKGLMCHGKSKTCLCLDSYLRYDQRKLACVASKGSVCGSVKSASSWGSNFGEAYVECEEGECQEREKGGKKMSSICV